VWTVQHSVLFIITRKEFFDEKYLNRQFLLNIKQNLLKEIFNKFVFIEKLQKKEKEKEKIEARAAMVIKEITFHPHCWMSNLSCHLKSPEIYSLTTLNAHCCFVSKGIPLLMKISQIAISFNKHKSSRPRIPWILFRIVKSHEKGKKYLIKVGNILNLCVFNTQRLGVVLMDQYILCMLVLLKSLCLKRQKAR